MDASETPPAKVATQIYRLYAIAFAAVVVQNVVIQAVVNVAEVQASWGGALTVLVLLGVPAVVGWTFRRGRYRALEGRKRVALYVLTSLLLVAWVFALGIAALLVWFILEGPTLFF